MPDSGRFLIAIGSPDAPGMGLDTFDNVKTDVERMAAFFTSAEQNYQRVLAEEIPLGAKASRIKQALERWFSDNSRREDDCVVIYYAGHGEQAGKFAQHYLFTSDSDPRRLTGTAIETAELPKLFFAGEGQRPQSVLMILDTCYGAEGGGQAAAAVAAVRRNVISGMGAGFYILASAGSNDTADDGAFVDAFLEIMNDPQYFGRGTPEYCSFDEIWHAVNSRLKTGQRAVGDSIGGPDRQTFIRNTRYVPLLTEYTLEAQIHWDLTSRGVDDATFSEDFFVGRETALAELRLWLDAPQGDRRARVVTGDPGSGKSAVLGRLLMEGKHEKTHKPNVSISARRLSLPQIAESFGKHLEIEARDVEGILEWLSRPGPPVIIVVDGLDEALDVRATADRLLIPLARLERVRMIVGVRKDRPAHTPMGDGMVEIDLDAPSYFRRADVEIYVLRRLTEAGSGSLGQYDRSMLEALARRVADRGGHSFLYARVVSRWLVTADLRIDTGSGNLIDQIDIPQDAADAFGRDLDRFDKATRRTFIDLLMPLAYAQGKGIPQKQVWQQLAAAIAGRAYTNADIRDLKERASYYIIRDIDEADTVYRLFHEAFAQYLRNLSRDEDAEQTIYDALLNAVPRSDDGRLDWSRVREPYILDYLAVHAMNARRLGELLRDTEFMLHANPRTLAAALRAAPSDAMGRATAYLHAYPHLLGAVLSTRVQYLALSAARFNCQDLLEDLRAWESGCDWFPVKAWYHDTGSHVIARAVGFETACLMHSPDGTAELALVTGDRIRLLSLADGREMRSLAFAGAKASAAIEVPGPDRTSLAVAFEDGNVLLADLTAQTWSRVEVRSTRPRLCAIGGSGDQKVAIGDDDGQIWVWSENFSKFQKIKSHKAAISFLGYGTVQDRGILITGSDAYESGRVRETQQLRVWDARTLKAVKAFSGPPGSMLEWSAPVEIGGKAYIVGYFFPGMKYRLYDLRSGKEVAALDDVNSRPFGLMVSDNAAMLLSGFADAFRSVRIAEASPGSPVIEATASMTLEGGLWLGPIRAGGRPTVVSVGNDVRVWDLERLADRARTQVEAKVGHLHEDGEPLFCLSAPAVSGYFAGLSRFGNLRVWTSEGQAIAVRQVITSLESPSANEFDYLQMIDFADTCLYVTAGHQGAMRAWHLDGRPASPRLGIGASSATAFGCHAAGERLLATVAARAGEYYEVSVWDPLRGEELTSAGRFGIEDYPDKAIDHVVIVEDSGRTIIVGALGNSAYHAICAWDLNSAPTDALTRELRRKFLLPPQPRASLWNTRIGRQIKCLGTARYYDVPVIAVGDVDGWITLLRASDGQRLAGYRAHDKEVVGVQGGIVGSLHAVISAGSDGGITVVDSLPLDGDPAAISLIRIDVGDRIRTMAVVPGGRVVVGSEEGFLLFQLTASTVPRRRGAMPG
jgi:hypothetical protein